ncbi:MAG: hypothetical protein R3F55_10745 [Alphaproteobacteria bacterium]
MLDAETELLFGALLAGARLLRQVPSDTDMPATAQFCQSPLGLAALIEMWCVDNAPALVPENGALPQPCASSDDAAVAALAARFDPGAAPSAQ